MPEGCHINFAHDPLQSYFDECQKNEIYLLYLHFIVTSFLFISCISCEILVQIL